MNWFSKASTVFSPTCRYAAFTKEKWDKTENDVFKPKTSNLNFDMSDIQRNQLEISFSIQKMVSVNAICFKFSLKWAEFGKIAKNSFYATFLQKRFSSHTTKTKNLSR